MGLFGETKKRFPPIIYAHVCILRNSAKYKDKAAKKIPDTNRTNWERRGVTPSAKMRLRPSIAIVSSCATRFYANLRITQTVMYMMA